MFLLGIGGVGIREYTVEWKHNTELYKLLYAFIYRLYFPSHFADSSYKIGLDEKNQVIYTLRIKGVDYPGFRPIHARTPFDTRTHVQSHTYLPATARMTWSMQTFFTRSKDDIATVCDEDKEKAEILPNQEKDGLIGGETCLASSASLLSTIFPSPFPRTFPPRLRAQYQ